MSFVGGSSEWEVKTAAFQRLAQWCHAELVPPTPRRLPPPAPGQGQVATDPAPTQEQAAAPEPVEILADAVDSENDEETLSDGE